MIWPWNKHRDPFDDAPQWARVLREQLSTIQRAQEANQKEIKELIMSTTNDALKALDAQTTELENRMTDLGTAVQKEVADAVADITKILGNTVVNPAVITAITARLKTLSDNSAALTTTTTAADDQINSEANPPADNPPANTGTVIPVDNPPSTGGTTADNPPANTGNVTSGASPSDPTVGS